RRRQPPGQERQRDGQKPAMGRDEYARQGRPSTSCRRWSVADRRQERRPRRVDWYRRARWPHLREFTSGGSERMEEFKLGAVVFGDGGEVLVERHVEKLDSEDGFLGAVDEHEDVAEPLGFSQSLEGAVKGDDGGAKRAVGLVDADGGRLDVG